MDRKMKMKEEEREKTMRKKKCMCISCAKSERCTQMNEKKWKIHETLTTAIKQTKKISVLFSWFLFCFIPVYSLFNNHNSTLRLMVKTSKCSVETQYIIHDSGETLYIGTLWWECARFDFFFLYPIATRRERERERTKPNRAAHNINILQ